MKNYIRYYVGDKFNMKLGKDGAVFEVIDDQCMAVIGFTNITDEELSVLEKEPIDCRLSIINGIIFISFVFGKKKIIFNMPFNICLYSKFTLKNPYPYGYIIPIIIVENSTNIIKALRVLGWDNNFSFRFYKFCERQWTGGIENYTQRLNNVYNRYSDIEILKKSIIIYKVR